ncbi:MAG: hypothetical protein NZ898_02700 [Myxococcota bacterium]|nr:hypothetical protein [Myxococcota bacterium]MDW8361282.1 cytochrome c [Myxococcales bacterium]
MIVARLAPSTDRLRCVRPERFPRSAAAVLVVALMGKLPVAGALAQQASIELGRRALVEHGCVLCHDAPGIARPSVAQSCTGCHQALLRRQRPGLGSRPRVRHFVEVPDLAHAAARLRPDYLARYLERPHDVRPRLEEAMPRLPVTAERARAIVAYLRAQVGPPRLEAAPAPSPANVDAGRAVFVRACASCHAFGNLDPGFRLPAAAIAALGPAATLAPNLRFVRDRMDPGVALAVIVDPTAVHPAARMPRPSISRQEAIAVRDFLYLGDAGRPAAPPQPPPAWTSLPMPSRRVGFDDVRRIFQRSCVHCHAHSTDAAAASAFGFDATALDLASYEGVLAGVRLPDGRRRSVLAPGPDGVPPLLARLLRRHEEAVRDVVPEGHDTLAPAFPQSNAASAGAMAPGMPLALPPLPLSDVGVVAAWIRGGTPR